MQAWILFAVVALFVLLFVYPFYTSPHPGLHPAVMAAVKGFGTFVAAGLACYGALRLPEGASWLLTAGLAVCTVADIVLVFHFPAGTGCFFLAHLLYLSAFLRLAPFRPVGVAVFFLLGAMALVYFYPELRKKKRAAPYFLYGAALLLMLSAALTLPARLGARGFVVAAGALLFAASDFLIARASLKKPLRRQSRAVMGLYYCAQLLLSLAALQPWR